MISFKLSSVQYKKMEPTELQINAINRMEHEFKVFKSFLQAISSNSQCQFLLENTFRRGIDIINTFIKEVNTFVKDLDIFDVDVMFEDRSSYPAKEDANYIFVMLQQAVPECAQVNILTERINETEELLRSFSLKSN